jgi:branched-chain amino acid transport system permease protein
MIRSTRHAGLAVAALVLLLAALPHLLSQGLLNAAIQMLIAALFACAYNLLCGQAGMLSFGHAAYFGVGAFATVHAMKALGGAGVVPTPLLPLAGAAAGLAVGAAAGWFATKRSGTYFAMITLAIAELRHSPAPQLQGWFGGEAGVSAMRMPAFGISFGSTTHVYYLTMAWVLACLAALYLYTRTPLGRLTQGLRENSHRLAFLGYDVHRVSVLVFSLSAMFSGIAGGLQVINNEAANYVLFDMQLSAAPVLHAFIGGVKVFLGPAIGAAMMTFFGHAVSDLTQSWLLYQGILFVLVMMFMPNGLAGLWLGCAAWRERVGTLRAMPALLAAISAGLLLAAGTVFAVELLQRLFAQDYRALARAAAAQPWPSVHLFGRDWLPGAIETWLVPVALFLPASLLAVIARRMVRTISYAADPGAVTAKPTERNSA